MNATVNAARHPQGIRRAGRQLVWLGAGVLLGAGCIHVAGGNRNHKNNNHIIVFNNEKYHFRHNFWLLFVQATKCCLSRPFLPVLPCPHFGWLPAGLKQPLNTLKY